MKRKARPPFPGLQLSREDRDELKQIRRAATLTDRQWRRVQILEMLHGHWNLSEIASTLGMYPREVRRVGWRYLDLGLEQALKEDHRYTPVPCVDERQKSTIVAMVCSNPPEGRARWTVALIAEEAIRRRIVKTVSRETVRKLLADHDLKPWREKNVVCSRAG
jgi:putative transposase